MASLSGRCYPVSYRDTLFPNENLCRSLRACDMNVAIPYYNRIMKSTLRLNARIFPIIGVLAFIMQIVDPSRVWDILLVAIGGTW